MSSSDLPRGGAGARAASVFFKGVAPFLVVGCGILGAVHFVNTAPKASQRPPRQSSVIVTVRTVQPADENVVIETMGTVVPAQEIVLQPQVSGIILEQHPALTPGGRIEKGETLVKIDSADYEVALKQAQATLAHAEAQLLSAELERKRVMELNERQATTQKELDNVRTMMATAEADVDSARAAVDKAGLDLSRTTVKAPFTCVVTSENVDLGALVTPQTQLASLVGADEYWVRVTIPVDQLHWIKIPSDPSQTGAIAVIRQRLGVDSSAERDGRVLRLLGDLEPQGRMARLLVTVPRPLDIAEAGGDEPRPPLLLGSYVDVVIEGRKLKDVFALQRDELHDGANVWIMTDDNVLDIRPVDVAFRGRELILVRGGLAEGERLVASDLPAPVSQMPLRLAGQAPEEASPAEPEIQGDD